MKFQSFLRLRPSLALSSVVLALSALPQAALRAQPEPVPSAQDQVAKDIDTMRKQTQVMVDTVFSFAV